MSEHIHTVDLIRHAHSAMNGLQADPDTPPFIGGRQNHVPLDERGEEEALDLGIALLQEGYAPSTILSSPAVRTMQTCEISTRVLFGTSKEPTSAPDFQELDQGDWTNKPRTLYDDPAIKERMARLGWDFRPPRGESMRMVASRALWRLGELAVDLEASDTPQHVLAFTHGVAIKTAIGTLLGWSHDETYKKTIDNVSRTRLLRANGRWHVSQINGRVIPARQ
ncbi:MAG TPA: histidine phosphatase family protein [Candidatus Saccharimonadales bacterium]|nr:histidine phosphatase family protein [Candidatus Saccharimonadales bacterium]